MFCEQASPCAPMAMAAWSHSLQTVSEQQQRGRRAEDSCSPRRRVGHQHQIRPQASLHITTSRFPTQEVPSGFGDACHKVNQHHTSALDRRAPHLLLPPHCSSSFAPPLFPPHSCLSNLHTRLLCPHQLLLTHPTTAVWPPPASPHPFKYCFPLPRATWCPS